MRLLPLLVLPVLAICLSGCTDSAGPLVLQSSAKSCADGASVTDAVIGIPIQDAGPHPITITSLAFGTSKSVTVKDAWIVPDYTDGPNPVGVGISQYPLDSPAWSKRQPIVGATVQGNTFSNIAVRLRLDSGATTGFASDATVKYTDADNQRYVASAPVVIGFGPGGKCG